MKKKKGFTLIELLAVVVILGVIFMFITPKLLSLINNNERTETQIIEERVLNAARDYVNNYDGSFYEDLIHTGDVSYVYKTDLIEHGFLDESDVSSLENFTAVKGELLDNDKVRYTLT